MITPPPSFFEEETRLGHTISPKMKRVWAIQIEMAQRIFEVCNKHNIKAFADGGTVLGAVRHQGYIPWDDDVDILMFRSDYDRFCAIAPQEFTAPYHFQSGLTDTNYQRGHAQLRYDGTSAILHSEVANGRKVKYHLGIFVDIFVLDGIEDDEKLFNRRRKKYNRLRSLMRARAAVDEMQHPTLKQFIVGNTLKICGLTVKKLFSRSEKILRSVAETSEWVAPLGFEFSKGRSCRKRQFYDNSIMLPFEYIELPVPSQYADFLRILYGNDYMTPRKVATLHGGFAVLDPDEDYVDVQRRMLKEE